MTRERQFFSLLLFERVKVSFEHPKMGWVGLWCLMPLSIISPLYSGGQFLKLRKGPEILKWRTEREILMNNYL